MLQTLRLQNFRSHTDSSFELDAGVNIIVGPNACGKTNLLESVYLLACGHSFRARDNELIQIGKSWARIDGYISGIQRTIKLQSQDKLDKTFEIDENVFKRLSLAQSIPLVLFEPNDLLLLTGGPQRRRDYIDTILTQLDGSYKQIKNRYERAVLQRNSLLKNRNTTKDQLFIWNIQVSEFGGQLVYRRLEIITKLNKQIHKIYGSIAHKKSHLTLTYKTPLQQENYSSALLKQLEKTVESDAQKGFTSFGPHREDIEFSLNDKMAAQTASRGETRTILLALKVLEAELLTQQRGQKPIVLLDDVFSELDGSRRRYLVEFLKDYQVLITTTDADAVIEHFTAGHNLIALS